MRRTSFIETRRPTAGEIIRYENKEYLI